MKSYEETTKKVLFMRDNILRKRAEKRKMMITFCTTTATLCLALVIGIGISRGAGNEKEPLIIGGAPIKESQRAEIVIEGGEGDKKIPDIYLQDSEKNEPNDSDNPMPQTTEELIEVITSAKTGLVTEPPVKDGQAMDICRGLVYINRIVGEATAAKRTYDKMNYYSEQISAEEAEKYYGIDMYKILSSLPTEMKYIPSGHTFIKKNDGTTADDSAHFYIDGGDNGNITISCGKALPPYDCIYMLCHETASEITTESGETVGLLMGYKDNDEESGICGLFFADFKIGSTYYRVECRNVNTIDGTIGALIGAIIY